MKKRIYLAKANHKTANHENQTNASVEKQNHRLTGQTKEQLLEISGSEFYRIVSASDVENMEPRYFIRLTDDIDYECPEIFVEVSKDDYAEWKREYNLHLYRRKIKSCYVEVPFDDALLFLTANWKTYVRFWLYFLSCICYNQGSFCVMQGENGRWSSNYIQTIP